MIIIQPSVSLYREPDPLLKIERCARVCYKSEEKIFPGSAERLVKNVLINRGHESPLSHYRVKATIAADTVKYFIFSQYLRVRTSNDPTQLIVTGTVRAWRDHIKILKDTWIGTMLATQFYKWCPPLFEDVLRYLGDTHYIGHPENVISHVPGSIVEKIEEDTDFYTFIIETDRAIANELICHISIYPTQESTRYCDYGKGDVRICDPVPFKWSCQGLQELADSDVPAGEKETMVRVHKEWVSAIDHAVKSYQKLRRMGIPPEQARTVLPLALATTIVFSGSLKAWMNVIRLRTAQDAHPQVKLLVKLIDAFFTNMIGVDTAWMEPDRYVVDDTIESMVYEIIPEYL